MNVWIKLGVPVLLGALAAGVNWMVLDSELKPYEFVKVSQEVRAGETLRANKLEKFTLRSKDGAESLDQTVVKWSERAMLYNVPCVRSLKAGDLVLWRDAPAARKEVTLKKNERALQIDLEKVKYEPSLLLVGNQIGFVIEAKAADSKQPRAYVVEGPFRIVSVGRRVSAQAEGDSADLAGARILTIAIETDSGAGEGSETVEAKVNRVIQARRTGTIEALVLYPAKD